MHELWQGSRFILYLKATLEHSFDCALRWEACRLVSPVPGTVGSDKGGIRDWRWERASASEPGKYASVMISPDHLKGCNQAVEAYNQGDIYSKVFVRMA